MAGERPYRRLADLKQPLAGYQFCNPETLSDNLATLASTHSIEGLAFFDQFPYPHHLESGVVLSKKTA